MTDAPRGGEHRSRIGVIVLELGPSPSARELLGALGDALARSEVGDELTLIRALRELIGSPDRPPAGAGGPHFRRRPCSLAG